MRPRVLSAEGFGGTGKGEAPREAGRSEGLGTGNRKAECLGPGKLPAGRIRDRDSEWLGGSDVI